MENYIVILISFLITGQCTFGQSAYLPIIKKDAEWFAFKYEGNSPDDAGRKRYRFDENTMFLGSKNYHQMYVSKSQTGPISIPKPTFIREETGKLWVWDTTQLKSETLILDMNLALFDTFVEVDLYQGLTRNLYVVSVDTVKYLDEIPRKRIMLACYPNDPNGIYTVWVEGVGRLRGMFEQGSVCYPDNSVDELRCYYENSEEVILPDDGKSCWYLVNTEEETQNPFVVYPNPANEQISFIIPIKQNTPYRFEIVNGSGQILRNGETFDDKINISDLPSGIYFLTIQDKSGHLWRGKWVKQ